MPFNYNKEQKSPKRRFLLILGTAAFICFVVLGLMIMFWDALPLQLQHYQRLLFGAFIIGYAILRFSRLFKKDQYED
ncbi:hypothetical protein FHW88_000212 [Mucilaginibacter sp. SG538B]|jgi:hypothetical protein|uniref:Uncharacterized protein n=3 Tax=Mucilaginibacter TaxID=423349 RepID=A0AAE6MJK2_9SPHI|nr:MULTISPECIES: hypothetical protein [Mucilaginibacter]QEM18063.1 hypothetical protein DIU38_019055 [Mucilaginibacter gossypii]SCW84284.1 hypothetical protein SAMN03159284_04841 [Mucilaginibacter sp. NFR10]SEO62900.1 hypothetical protein SAMN05192574_11039 [Mucilaginibacter gossypiicola]NVM61936.1 hypothetical protein [Mucilaginibacter sp. SG538B]QEM05479.1 hypothetical protein DIU31_018875 [Mucilaginibacter rubeus]